MAIAIPLPVMPQHLGLHSPFEHTGGTGAYIGNIKSPVIGIPDFVKWVRDQQSPISESSDDEEVIVELYANAGDEKLAYPHAKQLFAKCFDATVSECDTLRRDLIRIASPELILQVAMEDFGRKGNADRIALAASLLEEYGIPSLRVIQRLAETNSAECEFFVDTLTNLAHQIDARAAVLTALLRLARHPSTDVRWRLFEAADSLPDGFRLSLLAKLASDSEEDIAEAARELLDAGA